MALAGIILFWGLGPPVSKLIEAPSVISVLYRFWLSVPLMWLLATATGSRPTFGSIRRAAWAGAAFGINLVFVFLAINEAAVAVLSAVVALQPGFILVLAGPLLGERPTRWHVGWTIVGMTGTAIVVLAGGPDFEVTPRAIGYALAAQLFFTAYFLITKKVRSEHDIDPIQWMFGVVLFAALAVTPWAVATSSSSDYRAIDGNDWIWLALIIVFTGGLGHILMTWVHRFVDATRSSLYLLLMHPVVIIAAWIIHDEPLTFVQMSGGLVLLGAVSAVISRPATPAASSVDEPIAVPVQR